MPELARARARRRAVTIPVIAGLVVLALWELASRAGLVDPFFLPAPSAIAQRLAGDLGSGLILGYLGTTLREAVAGTALAAAVALPLGYLVAKSRLAARIIEPYAAASQAVPAIALAPLLLLWIPGSFLPIVVLCALMVFFPVMLGTIFGLRHIPTEITDAARLDGAHGTSLLAHIEWPLALPALLTGLRNGFTLSITGAIVGEWTMGGRGMGMVLPGLVRAADTVGLFA
ncbi:MAG: ABC transporter permease subunit, partial [bacterium]|nr:ABC transporter permease subunit [bacterium]